MSNTPQAVFRTADAANYLGIAAATLEKLRLKGAPASPPFIKIGSRAVGYLRSDLDSWLETRRRTSTSDAA